MRPAPCRTRQRLAVWLRTAPGRYRKAIAGLWGYLTVPVVVGILALVGVHIDGDTAAWIIAAGAAILGTGAVVRAKPNDAPPAVDPLYAEDVPRLPNPGCNNG
ncbi:hypothetical protein [Amycolatopsis benzoatilytica]|uniref:hypothetical protein n=1 Tax=Amycolatopsis benzoatilytica TaxID=346045 RepID=UPI000377D5CD|nr:hypothetical protein [Amycolatopsis benzoatilytica]